MKHLTQKIISSSILTILIMILFTTQAYAYPISDGIAINSEIQEKSHWCWAACAKTILNHFGFPVTQTQFVNYVKDSNDAPDEVASDGEVQSGLEHWGISSEWSFRPLSFNSIMSEIYNYDRPIYGGWLYPSLAGHALVINGYIDLPTDYITYMDPADGTFHTVTYTWFVGGSGYDHMWIGAIYNMSN